MTKTALVIGGGPAGLMAAEQLSHAGMAVTITEAKPSFGRKFLMAGKSGLNLTKVEDAETFRNAYDDAHSVLRPMLDLFPPEAIIEWANELGGDVFVGSTGRVFPKVMKASPLLRAWIARLAAAGVEFMPNWRWIDVKGNCHGFDTPNGPQTISADVTIYAMGGASWKKLGSNGLWKQHFDKDGINTVPFAPSNSAINVDWSPKMAAHFGSALKSVMFKVGDQTSRGEAILSAKGLEGGGVYTLSKWLRDGQPLIVDLTPDRSLSDLHKAFAKPKGKKSMSNVLRQAGRLDPVKIALLQECARPLPNDPQALAQLVKHLPIPHQGLRPIDEAISTSGGVSWTALDASLMIKGRTGHFCAGEMIDWDAPTGGYLLTACFATGAWAGRKAAEYLANAETVKTQ